MTKTVILSALVLATGMYACGGSKSTEEKAVTTSAEQPESSKASEKKEVSFTVAEKYFIKNDAPSLDDPKIETEEEFSSMFGTATVMGEDGKPTSIDFGSQYVIAVAKPATDMGTKLHPVSLMDDGNGQLTFTYRVEKGEKQSFTVKPTLIVIVDKTNQGEVKVQEVD